MSPEMVERVAARLRAMYDPTRPSMDAIARYALALAERAAREALVFKHLSDVQWETGRVGSSSEDVVRDAMQRAVEGA